MKETRYINYSEEAKMHEIIFSHELIGMQKYTHHHFVGILTLNVDN